MSLRGPIHHRSELQAGLCAQLTGQHAAICLEAAAAFDPITFRQVRLNQGTLCAFTKRIGAHGYQRGLYRLSAPPQLQKLAAQGLQRVQQSLSNALAFDQSPIVVPPGQQIEGINSGGHDPQVVMGG
jgi:hypothetical protein